MDLDTLEMLRSSLRHVLTEESDLPLAARLDELGWSEVLADDESVALRTLFELKGETLSATDALGPQLAAALAAASGETGLGGAWVVLPLSAQPSTPTGDTVEIGGVLLSWPTDDASIVVPVGGPSGVRLGVVPASALHCAPLGGTDEPLGLVEVRGTVSAAAVRWVNDEHADLAWTAAVARGRWLVSAELVGIARHVLAAAVEYTGARVQYGRAIGTFQALQHRVASAYAVVVGAGHVVEAASTSRDPWDALVAKALAGQAAEAACTQAQQCYGAIGFTWEHEFHRYLRRTYLLDSLLGSWRSLEFEIGATLQRTGVVPQIGTL